VIVPEHPVLVASSIAMATMMVIRKDHIK
jgi:hypothetical protein